MKLFRLAAALAVALSLGAPALAADKTPLASYPGAPNQPIKSTDTLSVVAAKVTGISGSTQCVQASSAGLLSGTGAACGGAGGSPGGSSGQIQYNNAGAFGGGDLSGDCTTSGALAVTCSRASSSVFGVVKVDNTTITASGGVISAVGGASGAVTQLGSVSPSATSVASFTSISGSYSELRVVCMMRSDAAGTGSVNLLVTFNSDTAANYARQRKFANGTTSTADQALGQNSFTLEAMKAGDIAGYAGVYEIIIPFYANTTFYKSVLARNNQLVNTTTASLYDFSQVGVWASTSAITRIDLTLASGNYVSGSKCILYGIS